VNPARLAVENEFHQTINVHFWRLSNRQVWFLRLKALQRSLDDVDSKFDVSLNPDVVVEIVVVKPELEQSFARSHQQLVFVGLDLI
jgi:hypothetical protein